MVDAAADTPRKMLPATDHQANLHAHFVNAFDFIGDAVDGIGTQPKILFPHQPFAR